MSQPPNPAISRIDHARNVHGRKTSAVMVQRSPAISDSISSTGWDDVDTEKAIESEPLSPIDENYSNADQVQIQTSPAPKLQLEGWRLPVVFLSIFIGLFLSFLDTSIVAVALATIASKFHSFADSSWVFSSYLLTYMAFSIILARLSDFIGLKTVEALSMGLFLAFSGACGGAQNMTQLIIFRSIQGIGGSGLYSMCMVISLAAVPVSKISEMATYVSVTQAVAVVLGPILSGVITQRTDTDDWRWIFYLNLPLCSLALLGLLVAWPKRTRGEHGRPYRISFKRLEEIDFLGSSLLLVASVMVLFLGTYPLLIFGLQEAGARVYKWDSPAIVSSFWICGAAFLAFLGWEWLLERRSKWRPKPVFPVKVAGQRVMASAIIVTTLNGFLYYLIVLNLPIRFQLVSGDGPKAAGLRLLPMVVSSAGGTFFAGGLSKKWNVTAYTAIAGSALQIIGHGLMTTLSTRDGHGDMAKIYGLQILLGLGFGMSLASTTLLTVIRFLDQPQHTAVMQGCITQARSLGGSIGLSISTIIFNSKVHDSALLANLIPPPVLQQLYKSPLVIETMNPVQQEAIILVYAEAFKQQMWVATYIAIAAFAVSFGCWERKPPPPPGKKEEERRGSDESVPMNTFRNQA